MLQAQIAQTIVRDTDIIRAQAQRQFGALRSNIHSQHATTRCLEYLNCQLAKKPETDDRNDIAQFRIRRTNSMKSHCAERAESSVFKAHRRVGMNPGGQQARDASKFGVHSVVRSCTGNPIADVEIGYTFPNPDDRSRTAVPQSVRQIEPAANCSDGREQTISPNLANDFANQIRAGVGLLPQVLAGKLAGGALGPRRNQRCRHPNQNASGKQFGSGHIQDRNLARTSLLEYLSHDLSLAWLPYYWESAGLPIDTLGTSTSTSKENWEHPDLFMLHSQH